MNWLSQLRRIIQPWWDWRTYVERLNPNWRGVTAFAPGHFYSPLIDIKNYKASQEQYRTRLELHWSTIALHPDRQLELHREFLALWGQSGLVQDGKFQRRYSEDNVYFYYPDAFAAACMLLKFKPTRVVELGSGFSSAIMLDTCDAAGHDCKFEFVEPYPDRLNSLLTPNDKLRHTLRQLPVQALELNMFRSLRANDILFVDSSHVLKAGSDVEDIFLRILPVLMPGVILHFHDVFFPDPYPLAWIESGRAWNESLLLKLLLQAGGYEVLFFNSYLVDRHRELLQTMHPRFLTGIPASIWLKKLA
jgi:hypothetical protein